MSQEHALLRDVWHLQNLDWMSELSEEAVGKLRAASVHRDYRAGETIFAPEPEPHSVYLLERGMVRIYRLSREGNETTFGYVAPGEVFGELAAFGDYRRESFAEATRDSRVWKIQASSFRQLLGAQPELAVAITRQIGSRFKRIESRVEHLVFRDVRSRVAHILLELAEDVGERDGDAIVLGLEFTQAELATLVGSTRQTVNAHLREFEAEGVVGRHGRKLAIVDKDALRAIARDERG